MHAAAVALYPPSSPDPIARGTARLDPHDGWFIAFDDAFRALPDDEIRFDDGSVFLIRLPVTLRVGDTLNLYEMEQ